MGDAGLAATHAALDAKLRDLNEEERLLSAERKRLHVEIDSGRAGVLAIVQEQELSALRRLLHRRIANPS